MSLTHSQRAMIYLVSKGLTQKDFYRFMEMKPQRGSQMLDWRKRTHKWSQENRHKAMAATNNGLDVYSEVWEKVGTLLDKLPDPLLWFQQRDINAANAEAAQK